jgi:hypothetical protein
MDLTPTLRARLPALREMVLAQLRERQLQLRVRDDHPRRPVGSADTEASGWITLQ